MNDQDDTKSTNIVNHSHLDPARTRAFHNATEQDTFAGETASLLLHIADDIERERKRLLNELIMLQRVIGSQIDTLKAYPQAIPDRTWELGSSAGRVDHHIITLNTYRELAMLGNDVLDAAASNGDGEARDE